MIKPMEAFEYPLPVLSVSDEALVIETTGPCARSFTVRNTGGALLAGQILSRARCLTFVPSEWQGNETEITVHFTPAETDGWKPGDSLQTTAVIVSNGGEKAIAITVKLTQTAMHTKENQVIANITDFYHYARKYPVQARRLFREPEFDMLLRVTGFEYMEAYEQLVEDGNRERALDNFFILSGMKKKTTIHIPRRSFEFVRNPHDTGKVYGSFLVQKSDDGYFEAAVTPRQNASWLTLSADRLITADFNDTQTAMIKFAIDPLQIKGSYARETLYIGERGAPELAASTLSVENRPVLAQHTVELIFKRTPPLTVHLSREAYHFEDTGSIWVTNASGVDLMLELFCKDSCIRFEAKKYFVGEHYEIPFEIKMGRLQTAQLIFRKYPYITTEIEIKTIYHDAVIKKTLPLTVGEW